MRHRALLQLVVIIVSCRPGAAVSGAATRIPADAPDGLPAEPLFPCLDELLPCTAYLKATNKHPSNTCCTAMHRAAGGGQMPCMCRLLADPELLSTFNVTTGQTFRLPDRCALPLGCRAGADSEPVVEAPPPPSGKQHHYGSSDSSGDRSRCSDWRVIALAVFGAMVPVAVVF